jgi:putative membrane protein
MTQRTPLPRAQATMLILLAILLAAVQIDQPYPEVAPLQHIPTLLLLLAAPFLLRRWPMSNASVACIVIFFVLHTIGGRYTYSNVPYDAVARSLTGYTISEVFGFTRNHYDRFVHLSYGLLAVRPVAEALVRHVGITRGAALYIGVESVFAMGLCYEVFEWLLTIVMQGPLADAYNGQQGDIWDAQKDMALAVLGALIAGAVLKWRRPVYGG